MRSTQSHDPTARRARTRRWYLAIALGLAATTAVSLEAQARTDAQHPIAATSSGGNYVTTTLPADPSIDVSGFRPVCIGDAPFISYTIAPIGFTPADQSATLVIRSVDGTEVGTETVDSLTGQIIWPGASVDEAGNAIDWPGWKLAADGESWEPDPTDDLLRDGLTIEVTVDGAPPAIATVDYPPDDSACANPPDTTPPTTSPSTTSPDTTPTGTTPCVPGQDNDGDPTDDCDLASTGGGPGNLLLIGATILLAGLAALTVTRRRRGAPAARAD